MRDEHNRKRQEALGLDTPQFGYEQAYTVARKWFEGRDAGVEDEDITVAEACREYVADRREKKGEATARDAGLRFRKYVYDKPFGSIKVAKVHKPRIEQWRRDTGLGKASQDRTLRTLKAALNLAVANRRVRAEVAREWGDVKQHKNADGRRTLFLDVRQRRALLEHARADVRDLIEASILTGARPGELVNAPRSQFDERTRSMTFVGKTGSRTVPLSPAAVTLFARLARSKLPAAPLFMQQNGSPWYYTSAWAPLVREAAKLAGLPAETCLYNTRHAFITEAITGGMSTLDVARLTVAPTRASRWPPYSRRCNRSRARCRSPRSSSSFRACRRYSQRPRSQSRSRLPSG